MRLYEGRERIIAPPKKSLVDIRKKLIVEPAHRFVAARDDPTRYPGERPAGSYLLLNGGVHLMDQDDPNDPLSAHIFINGRRVLVEEILRSAGVASLSERTGMIGYGSNPVPGQLVYKYGKAQEEEPARYGGLSDITPVFKGMLAGAEAVIESYSYVGYSYADLLINDCTKMTGAEVWLTLFDPDQLQIINASEDISPYLGREPFYMVGIFPGFIIDGSNLAIDPLGYAGNTGVFCPRSLGSPISFSGIPTLGRSFREFDAVDSLGLMISEAESGIREEAFRRFGISPGLFRNRVIELMMRLNCEWKMGRSDSGLAKWFNDSLRSYVVENSLEQNLASQKREAGMLLEYEYANSAPKEFSFGELLKRSRIIGPRGR